MSMVERMSTLWTRKAAGPGGVEEEWRGVFKAAASIEEDGLGRESDGHAEVAVGAQVVGDHFGVVVRVDHDLKNVEGAKAGEGEVEEGAAGDLDEGFGAVVGEGAQAGAETRGEDHGFHGTGCSRERFSSSTWRIRSSTPGVARR